MILAHHPKYKGLNNRGQTTIQLLLPLVILLLISLAFVYMVPEFTTAQALAFGGGIIFFVVCLVSTEAALYLLIFSMLLGPEFIVGTTEGASLGRGVSLRVDDFLLLIMGFTWLSKMAIYKQLGLFLRTPLNRPIGYYIIICLTSTLWGAMFEKVDLKTGLFFVLKYFEYMFIYFMVVNHLRNKGQVRNYLWAMLITCAIVSIIGIAQIPGGGRVSAPFEGQVGEPNTLGGYLLFMTCITSGLFLNTTSFRARLIYGTLILLFLIPLFYTQSRSSYLAVIPAMAALFFLSQARQRVSLLPFFMGFLALFIVITVVQKRLAFTFTQPVHVGAQVKVGGLRLDTSTSARLMSMAGVLKNFGKHPFLGFGVTGYRFVDAQYFRVLIETGLLGLLAFLILMSAIFRQAYHIYKKTPEPFEKGLCIGFLTGFVGLLFHSIGTNTFIIVRIMEPFWFILAMIIVLPDLESESKSQSAAQENNRDT